jgi:hypothetical protein
MPAGPFRTNEEQESSGRRAALETLLVSWQP